MAGSTLAEILQRVETAPQRVVSLVPSYTDSLISLGFGETVVGVTDYCPVEERAASRIIRVGGPRNVRVEDVFSLRPDLVLANYEENTRQVVESLESHDIPVWVSFPRSVSETLDFLWGLVEIYRSQPASVQVRLIHNEAEWVLLADDERPRMKYFCPIWQGCTAQGQLWWMTFNGDTYPSSLLGYLGGENIFANRTRRYPLEADLGEQEAEDANERDVRYPCVCLSEILAGKPEIIFLPDEPYLFQSEDIAALKVLLSDTPAVKAGRVYPIDGTLISWYGTRLATAFAELPTFFSR